VAGKAVVRNIVLHTVECAEKKGTAKAVARFFGMKSTKVSAHFVVDDTEVIQCVKLADTAFHASCINGFSYGIEICGKAAQSSLEWHDDFSTATLEHVAHLCAQLHCGAAQKSAVPLVKLMAEDLLNGAAGFCGHSDVSKAIALAKARNLSGSVYFGAKSNGHTDPGANFPWLELLEAVAFHARSITEASAEVAYH
jgi:N-acetyl-anhydromuramyl-L-alanine amidase AmpD